MDFPILSPVSGTVLDIKECLYLSGEKVPCVVISNDKDAMPKAISKAIKRAIAALVIFFIPFLVDLIIDWLNTYSDINGAANCIK